MKAYLNTWMLMIAIGIANISLANTNSFNDISNQNKLHYEDELKAVNEFLKDFDDGFYGPVEVSGEFIVIHFIEGNYSKFRLQDMAEPVIYEKWGQLNWDCIKDAYCVETDWNEDGRETGILFSNGSSYDLNYLLELLTDFINAYTEK